MNHGFRLIEERQIKELEATARLLLHEKSGARFLHIENQDDNNVFSISFRTPPVDNTGMTHILEHSVLCGSTKFPTKEPFVDLAKGSLNTFLNAMTFSDKTMYPVASKNQTDFYNLVDVYMDAVLHPRIYECPEIMMQEGWHHEVDEATGELSCKGVVYNEMLGAFSSPEEILFSRVMQTLYPDTAYGFESGGDPDHIPELTNEAFLDYHRTYYHPANSYIYFYGNGSLDRMLSFLNEAYLCEFDKNQVEQLSERPILSEQISNTDGCDYSMPVLQKAFEAPIEREFEYPVSSMEEEEDGTYISLNFVAGNACDPKLSMSMDILEYMLLETPASPLKRALIDAEIGRDVLGNYDEGILQPMFNIVLKDSNPSEKECFLEIVTETLTSLAQNGLDKRLIEASINSLEFKFRESNGEDTPKGLLFGIRCMDSWLYNGDPFLHLEYEANLAEIKKLATEGYFEQLIRKYLLDNTHASVVILTPKFGLAEEKETELRNQLADLRNRMGEEWLTALKEANNKLFLRQSAVDSERDLEKIPMISISDIRTEAEVPPLEERTVAGTKVLYHKLNTNGIVYMDLLFDTSMVPVEKLPHLALLADVLGFMDTKRYSFSELSNEIDIHTGGIGCSVDAYEGIRDGALHPKLIVETKVIVDKLEKAVTLVDEVLQGTYFQDEKRLWEIILETKADIESELIEEGHSVASKRVCSYFSEYAAYMEQLTGLPYYNFIADLETEYEERFDETVQVLEELYQLVFTKGGLVASVTCSEQDYEQFSQSYPQIVDNLCGKYGNKVAKPCGIKVATTNEGIYNSSNIVHVAKGANFRQLGYEYDGRLQVLKNILSLDYLWNRIRVMGGAYGAFARFEMSGNAYFVSYRDPNLTETLEVIDGIAEYVQQFQVSDREMDKYIIGTISGIDQPLTPQQAAQRADELYFRGISQEDMQRERDQILGANCENIRSMAQMLRDLGTTAQICVVGNENLIVQNKDRFHKIYSMFDHSEPQDQ